MLIVYLIPSIPKCFLTNKAIHAPIRSSAIAVTAFQIPNNFEDFSFILTEMRLIDEFSDLNHIVNSRNTTFIIIICEYSESI